MKILNRIIGSIKKFTKGIFALFMINLFIFGGVLLVQSCQTDDEVFEINNIELDNFKSLVIKTSPQVKNTLKQNNIGILRKNSSSEVEENEAKEVLKPVVTGAKELLLSYGFTEQEISDEFGSIADRDILMAGLAILEIEKEAKENRVACLSKTNSNDLFFMFGQSLNAQTYEDFKHCAFDAAGIAGIGILLDQGISAGIKNLGKKAVLRMVGKVLARTLSWVGAAWAIADFSVCMYNS
jgi:hypothetical protein